MYITYLLLSSNYLQSSKVICITASVAHICNKTAYSKWHQEIFGVAFNLTRSIKTIPIIHARPFPARRHAILYIVGLYILGLKRLGLYGLSLSKLGLWAIQASPMQARLKKTSSMKSAYTGHAYKDKAYKNDNNAIQRHFLQWLVLWLSCILIDKI